MIAWRKTRYKSILSEPSISLGTGESLLKERNILAYEQKEYYSLIK
jgi:hypothetical protein